MGGPAESPGRPQSCHRRRRPAGDPVPERCSATSADRARHREDVRDRRPNAGHSTRMQPRQRPSPTASPSASTPRTAGRKKPGRRNRAGTRRMGGAPCGHSPRVRSHSRWRWSAAAGVALARRVTASMMRRSALKSRKGEHRQPPEPGAAMLPGRRQGADRNLIAAGGRGRHADHWYDARQRLLRQDWPRYSATTDRSSVDRMLGLPLGTRGLDLAAALARRADCRQLERARRQKG